MIADGGILPIGARPQAVHLAIIPTPQTLAAVAPSAWVRDQPYFLPGS